MHYLLSINHFGSCIGQPKYTLTSPAWGYFITLELQPKSTCFESKDTEKQIEQETSTATQSKPVYEENQIGQETLTATQSKPVYEDKQIGQETLTATQSKPVYEEKQIRQETPRCIFEVARCLQVLLILRCEWLR